MFHEKLQQALEQRGLKPIDLVRRTKLSDAAISRYLSGERTPNADGIILIAEALEVDFNEIMSWFKTGNPNLDREGIESRLMGLFREMDEVEARWYADSLESDLRKKKGDLPNEKGKPKKQTEKAYK